jgi:hypothetical protein
MKLNKQNNDIALLNSNVSISKLQVEKQKRGIELLKKEKALELAKVEKQKIETKKREEELKQQRIIRNISFLGIFLLFVVIFLIYRNLSINRKQNRVITAQKEEVERKNQLINSQKQVVEEKHREIKDSINYAERIQRSFLATKEMLDTHLHEYFVLFQPKEAVSGDFYWAGSLSNGNFALITADSTGHGVPGAIMSILNISCLENKARHDPHFALCGSDDTRAIGAYQSCGLALEIILHFNHILNGDALGDTNYQSDPGFGRFHYSVGCKCRGYEYDAHLCAGCFNGIGYCIEYGPVEVHCSAFSGSYATHHLGSVLNHL